MSFDPPKSRNEAILQNMLGANNVLPSPKGRIEELLLQILQQGGSGGGVTPEQIEAAVEAYLEEHPIDEPFAIPITRSGSTYTTTASAADILANIDNCVLTVDGSITFAKTSHAVNGSNTTITFSQVDSVNGYVHNDMFIVDVANGTVTVTYYGAKGDALPVVTTTDNGKFLRVVNGAWAAAAIQSAESNSFGGGS